MTDQAARYDRIAEGYARWWGPVIAPTAVRVLAAIEPLVEGGARDILDIGTGTGTLAIAAIRRWPTVRVTGIDASGEMVAGARAAADDALGPGDRARFVVRTAFADRLPFPDGAFDAAVSSFVLQLVPSRHAALVEAHRALGSGGRLAHVTWLVGGGPFEPDRVVDEVLDEFGYGPREDGPSGDLASVAAAAAGLRRAGFRRVVATTGELSHRFDVEGYARFIEAFDEEDLFSSLPASKRERIGRRLRRALAELPSDALVLRSPVVLAHGDRP